MKLNFRLIAKVGLLLALIGFFMPVACDKTGLEIAQGMVKHDKSLIQGLLLYLMALSAVAGVFIGIILLQKNNKVKVSVDWFVIIVCVASGLIVCFVQLDQLDRFKSQLEPQSGAIMILIGWIIAVGCQFLSKINREK
jgi:hypothetical protein